MIFISEPTKTLTENCHEFIQSWIDKTAPGLSTELAFDVGVYYISSHFFYSQIKSRMFAVILFVDSFFRFARYRKSKEEKGGEGGLWKNHWIYFNQSRQIRIAQNSKIATTQLWPIAGWASGVQLWKLWKHSKWRHFRANQLESLSRWSGPGAKINPTKSGENMLGGYT